MVMSSVVRKKTAEFDDDVWPIPGIINQCASTSAALQLFKKELV